MRANSLAVLVSKAYAAALDDALWADLGDAITSELGGVGGTVTVLDETQQSILKFLPIRRVADIQDEYLGTWWAFDPNRPRLCTVKLPAVVCDTDFERTQTSEATAYYEWRLRRVGSDHLLSSATSLGKAGLRATITVHRPPKDLATLGGERYKLGKISPHFWRALQLGFRHSEKLAERYWEGLSTQPTAEAVLLLDEHGRMMRATDAGLALIAENDGIGLRQGRLFCLFTDEDKRLGALIRNAIDVHAATAGATRVRRRSGRSPYMMTFYPLARQRRMLAPYEAAALVTITDPARQGFENRTILRQAFDLTAREAEFAALLLGGHSVESAAYTLGIAMPTARIHVRNLLAKTGTTNQAGFLRLASGLR